MITSAATTQGSWFAFGYQITATNSPASYGATGLPSGLSVNTASRTISGTPTASGTFGVCDHATNSGGTGSAIPAFHDHHCTASGSRDYQFPERRYSAELHSVQLSKLNRRIGLPAPFSL